MESQVNEIVIGDTLDRSTEMPPEIIHPWAQPGGRRYCGHDSGRGKVPGQPRNQKCKCGSGKKAKHCCK